MSLGPQYTSCVEANNFEELNKDMSVYCSRLRLGAASRRCSPAGWG